MRTLLKRHGKYIIWILVVGFLLGAIVIFTPGKFRFTQDQTRGKETAILVNGEKITQEEFEKTYSDLLTAYRLSRQPQGTSDALNRLILRANVAESLIREALLAQEWQRRGIKLSKAQVEARFEEQYDSLLDNIIQYILQEGNLTEEQVVRIREQRRAVAEEHLKNVLEYQGMTLKEYRRMMREQIEIELKKEELREDVVGILIPTDDELKGYFEENRYRFTTPERIKVRQILIKVAKDAPEEEVAQARERIEQIKQELDGGADFAELAKEYSEDDETAPLGGEMDWFSRGSWDPPFEEAAFALEVGETSEIVRDYYGFHIIELEDRQKGESFEDAKDEVRKAYVEEQGRERFEDWYNKEARAGADVKIELPLLKAYMLEQTDQDAALEEYERIEREGLSDDPYLLDYVNYYSAKLYEKRLQAAERRKDALLEKPQTAAERIEVEQEIERYKTKVVENLFEAARQTERTGTSGEIYQELLSLDEQNVLAHYEYARFLNQNGRYDQAKEQLDRTLELDPDHADALILYGDIMLKATEYGQAIERYKKALALKKDDGGLAKSIAIKLSQAYIGGEEYERAKELLAPILQEEPDNQQVLTLLGDVHFELEEYGAAAEYYGKALAGGPKPEIQVKLGDAYLREGKMDEAEEVFEQVVARGGFYATDAYLGLGNIHRARDEVEEALSSYREGFKRSGSRYDIKIELAKRIIELEPDDVETRFDLARTYQRRHNYDEAIEQYDTILETQTNSFDAFEGLGECYMGKEEFEQAKLHFGKAVQLAKSEGKRIQFYNKILEAEQKVAGDEGRLGEDGLDALYNLAKIYLIQGNKDEAKRQLERLKEENPEYRKEEVAKLWAQIVPPEEVEREPIKPQTPGEEGGSTSTSEE